ncbi:YncE family protein [Granulicella tundricola]|uniref:YVTN family beta-propeller repeat protein n=1 Tax=Granulicella tundricola (strain ATCC BAA-1859 / DSM 23138 / MP5ACTX9) TaxID=1198114 RepID=E8WY26_GRATM|nr:YncE family protein [Granulicella tundricola]ADW67565.1 YVTN family beta-propeller repeat protein [Granulicella tundricola MP5ACTX9]
MPTMMKLASLSLLLSSTIASNAHTPKPVPSVPFHVEAEWNVGGAGGWGFLSLDPANHQLYIPRTNRVMVVDTQTGKQTGEIAGMKNVRGIAIDDTGRYGYISDPTDGTAGFLRVFDRKDLKLIASVSTGLVPDTVVFEPATKLVFVFNSRGHSATIVDSKTNEIVATLPLAGRPSTAVGDGAGNIFVTLPAMGEVVRIGAASREVTASWQLAPCTGPNTLAVDPKGHRLFTTCESHKIIAINTGSGAMTPVGDAPAGSGDMGFDEQQSTLFLADATGMLTSFHRDGTGHYASAQQLKTQPGARTMIVNQEEGKVYLVTSKFGQNTGNVSEELQYRPTPVPGTFSILVVGRRP